MKKLIVIVLCFYGIQMQAQKTLPQGSVWYSYGVSDPSKIIEITITHQDETYMKVQRKLVTTNSDATKEKKKKGGFLKNIKNALEDKPNSSTTNISPLEGEFNYKLVADNTDDGIYTEGYKYDESVYGFVYPIGNGLYKEVVFTKDTSVPNFLKNEDPATASIYIMGADKEAVKAKAASLTATEELKKYYTPDYSTGRLKDPAVSFDSYNGANFSLDPENGTISLLQTTLYYLPSKTIEGRNIQYNWSAFKLKVLKEGKLVHAVEGQKGHRNGRWLEKVKNTFDMYGLFERLLPGKYQLAYSIYDNDPFFVSDFEIYTHQNPDINHEIGTIYNMKGPWDETMQLNLRPDDQGNPTTFAVEFPLYRLLTVGNEKNQVHLQGRLYKDGKLIGLTDSEEHPDGSANLTQALERRGNTLDLLYRKKFKDNINTQFHSINNTTKPSRWDLIESFQDGKYKIEYLVNGKPFAYGEFIVKGKKIQLQGKQVKESTNPKTYIMDENLIHVPITYKQ
ncbi:hypothetical protein FIA58_018725 [Flavobacterium jejuense]|uniref:Uncharacterized protein n=1 Tax=Flavobacterium jejuense TaxID=1544455 RepID=A0ABX0IX22_9FLAO|nr:hypothetical protein [Flavobacterium jejuense]NHN27721.1 hypothetical protein [Flavobacterium jejuense]